MNAKVDISNVTLETERLRIRPWKREDVEDFYEYAKVDGVGQMAGWNPHASIEESEQVLKVFLQNKNVFALELKENHKVIGSIGLEELSLALESPYNQYVGREIGYVLSKEYWGNGLMPEAVGKVVEYCFEEENYKFLLCSHSLTNIQSKRVIEKCGFHFVKESVRGSVNGETHPSLYYVLENKCKIKKC